MGLNRLLEGLLHAKDVFCCLCFKTIAGVGFRMHDHLLTELHGPVTEELGSILNIVLGYEVTSGFTALDRVCEECAKLALSSFKFIVTSRENYHNLSDTLDCIATSLETVPIKKLNVNKYKSFYLSISINHEETSCATHYDLKQVKVKSRQMVLKQFKNLMKPQVNGKVKQITTDVSPLSSEDAGQSKENSKYTTVKSRDGSKVYCCKICHGECDTLKNIMNHYKNLHTNFFKSRLRKKHNNNAWVCSNCGKIFKNKCLLLRHELVHEEKIPCPKCKKSFKNSYYDRHICVSEEQNPTRLVKEFVCDLCGAEFTRKFYLTEHIKFDHGPGVKLPHKCSQCKKKFNRYTHLKSHLLSHNRKKYFKCETCNRQFVTKQYLICHIRAHTGEKPFQCNFCEKCFTSKSRRADHTRVHHMEPSLPCDFCIKKFKSRKGLNKHKRFHLNPKSSLFIGVEKYEKIMIDSDT